MSKFGFVYCLENESFPGVYKIGCTTKPPHQRAIELSTTGVPTQYYVLAYIECRDFAFVENDIHRRLSSYRVNQCREFFKAPLELIAAHMWNHPERIVWSDNCMGENIGYIKYWELDNPYLKKAVI